MSLLTIARDTLKEIPMSDIVRERLSLALDRLSDVETKIEALQSDKGSFQAQLERERLDHKQTRDELQRLKDEHAEEVRFVHDVEFRKGSRTGGQWLPFCPKCHLPISYPSNGGEAMECRDSHCGWESGKMSQQIRHDQPR